MSKSAQREPDRRQDASVTALHGRRILPDVMKEILGCNDASKAHEDLWSRTRQATDLVSQAEVDARKADADRDEAELDYKAALAENPERCAPRPRQRLIAASALALDGVACYFAAEALGGTQPETLGWTALFLALLGVGELVLDHYRDGYGLVWRWLAFVLGAFIGLLGLPRAPAPSIDPAVASNGPARLCPIRIAARPAALSAITRARRR